MKTSVLQVSTTPATIAENSESGKIVKVLTLVVSNTTNSAVSMDIEVYRFGDSFKIMKGAALPANRSVSVFMDKDFGVFLENGDQLRLSASAAGTSAVCSYEVVDDVLEPSREAPTSRVLRSFSDPTPIPEEDLTECPAGPCLGSNWFCCPDNIYCAPTAEYCPSGSNVSSTVVVSGVSVLLSDYFGDGPVRLFEATRGSELVVPEGFGHAVFVSSYGKITQRAVSPGDVLTFRSGILLGPKFGCCYPYDGNFYRATYETCTKNNQDGRNVWLEDGCVVEGSNEYEIMSNLSEFREYSLDKDLMDLFFNQGVNATVKDLDEGSALGGSEFSLTVNVSRRSIDLFGDEFDLPEDIQIYIYAESYGGTEAQGMISASKVAGENKILVTLNGNTRPDGNTEFSFQMNLEHEDFATLRTTFLFRNEVAYEQSVELSGRVFNMPGRLTQAYMDYLHSWISDFWAVYDAGGSTTTTLTRPESNANTEFYPFSHALWRLTDSGASAQTTIAPDPFIPGNKRLVEPWNFLGVMPNVWKCIVGGGLYKSSDPEVYTGPSIWDVIFGNKPPVDNGFDCRSFSLAALRFLEQQLSEACPGTKVTMQRINTHGIGHAIIRVDLPGEPDPCCKGSFLYEPQTGDAFDDLDQYCAYNDCSKNPDGGNYDPEDDPGIGDPSWEDDPDEVERITNLICGCLPPSPIAGSAEESLSGKCDDGTFGDWFTDQFSWDPGGDEPPPLNFPQILSCDKVVCVDPSLNYGEKCVESHDGVAPYVCEMLCIWKWECSGEGPECSLSRQGGYETLEECQSWCEYGSWCEIEATSLLKTGQCHSGPKTQWKTDDDNDEAGDFQGGKTCEEIECPVETQCYQTWFARWDCASQSWNRQGDTPYVYCGGEPAAGLGSWVPATNCVYEYNVATGASCSSAIDCAEFDVPTEDPSTPPLPTFTPQNCCEPCPDMCEWLFRLPQGTWESISGGIGVSQSYCEEHGCGCSEPNFPGSFNLEVNVTLCRHTSSSSSIGSSGSHE